MNFMNIEDLLQKNNNNTSAQPKAKVTLENTISQSNDDLFYTIDSVDQLIGDDLNEEPEEEFKPAFAPIVKEFEETSNPIFLDPKYYEKVLSLNKPIASRLHKNIISFFKSEDKDEQLTAKQALPSIYWNLLTEIMKDYKNATPLHKIIIRFGLISNTILKKEDLILLSKVVMPNVNKEPVLYLDEWLDGVYSQKIAPLAVDEKDDEGDNEDESTKSRNNLQKYQLEIKNTVKILKQHETELQMLEEKLLSLSEDLFNNPKNEEYGVIEPLGEEKRKYIPVFIRVLEDYQKKQIAYGKIFKELALAKQNALKYEGKQTDINYDKSQKTLDKELNSLQKLNKVINGRTGNHFPFLTSKFISLNPKNFGTRERIIEELRLIENIDCEIFIKKHKQSSNRIMPYVILVPSYGHSGFCWEAFEKRKKHFSRGRIGVPMYSHNLQRSIIEALAHYRWDLAKEMNSLRWMEEGLTGQYYQYYLDEKLKGDVRNYFMEDYILWITKESNGIQKLDKRIRDIFWRYIPFSAERKEDLKLRSSIYQRLYQLDINRSLSNGY